MPIYEYKCPGCGSRFEALVPISDRATAECPHCPDTGQQCITPVRLDYRKMGLDPDFATAYDKWGKQAFRRMNGKMSDSNNSHLTDVDVDRSTYDARNKVQK